MVDPPKNIFEMASGRDRRKTHTEAHINSPADTVFEPDQEEKESVAFGFELKVQCILNYFHPERKKSTKLPEHIQNLCDYAYDVYSAPGSLEIAHKFAIDIAMDEWS